jgi:hypothetical protein
MGNKEPKKNILNLESLLKYSARFKHYKNATFLNAKIGAVEKNNHILLFPEEPSSLYGCLQDDPVVLIVEEPGEFQTCQCYISNVNFKNNSIELLVHEIVNFENKRSQIRYPVSIYANILGKDKMAVSYINTISKSGLSIISNHTFEKGDIIEIDAELNNKNVYFKTKILWTKKLPTLNEYGLANIETVPHINELLQNILNDYILFKDAENNEEDAT